MVSAVKQVGFRFCAEGSPYVPPVRHATSFPCRLGGKHPATRLIEKFGAPLSGVRLVSVKDRVVGFDYDVEESARVAVYPAVQSRNL